MASEILPCSFHLYFYCQFYMAKCLPILSATLEFFYLFMAKCHKWYLWVCITKRPNHPVPIPLENWFSVDN